MSLDDTQALAAPVESSPAPSAPEAPSAAEPAADAPVEADLSKIWAKHNPDRHDNGQFKAREAAAPAEGADAETKPAEAAAEEKPAAEAPPVEAKPAVDAPRAWSAEQKALWGKIPAEAHGLIAKAEQELQDIRSAAGRMQAEYAPMKQVLDGYKPYLDQVAQGDAAGYVNRLLAASHALDRDPAGTIKSLAKAYGVDLGQIYDPLEPAPNQEVVALQREVAELRAAQTNQSRTAAASQEAAAVASLEKAVADFFTANPDAKGLESDLAAEIQAVRSAKPHLDHATLLKEAFERVAWLNPGLRDKRLTAQRAEQQKQDDAKRVAAAKEAAAKAKTAASVNVQGKAPSTTSDEADDWDATLRSTYRKLNAR